MNNEKKFKLSQHATKKDLTQFLELLSVDAIFSCLIAEYKNKTNDDGLVSFCLMFTSAFKEHHFNLYDAEVFNDKEKAALLRLVRNIYNGEVDISYLINGPYHFSGMTGLTSCDVPGWIKDIQLLDEWFKSVSIPGLKKLESLRLLFAVTSLLFDLKQYQVNTPPSVIQLLTEVATRAKGKKAVKTKNASETL